MGEKHTLIFLFIVYILHSRICRGNLNTFCKNFSHVTLDIQEMQFTNGIVACLLDVNQDKHNVPMQTCV